MHCVSELCYILIICVFNFLIFIHFTKKITLKPSLAQKLKLIFNFTLKGQINVPLWTHMVHKGWRKDRKTFIRCYTIVLKFWDEFNANFVFSYFSSYSSIKMWHLYLNKVVHLRLVLTYLFWNLFNSKKHLVLAVKKYCPFTFLCIPN